MEVFITPEDLCLRLVGGLRQSPSGTQTKHPTKARTSSPEPLASFPQYSPGFRIRKSYSDSALSATSQVLTSARLGMILILSVFIEFFERKKFDAIYRKCGPHQTQKSQNRRRPESEMRHLKTPLSELPNHLDLGIRQRSNSTRSTML